MIKVIQIHFKEKKYVQNKQNACLKSSVVVPGFVDTNIIKSKNSSFYE